MYPIILCGNVFPGIKKSLSGMTEVFIILYIELYM